jgi:general secretion pathway protein N
VIAIVVLTALPASLIARFLPPQVHAEDFSGSIWHGSAARITFDLRPVGALEWSLHPKSLLTGKVSVDLHWVQGSMVIDGNVALDAHGFVAHGVRGGGPIEDLGLVPGWHGNTRLDLGQVTGTFTTVTSAAGSIDVSALSSRAIAAGADLGSYQVTLAPDTTNAGSITAMIKDTGGPLEAAAEFRYTPASHAGLLSGTVRERPEASQALRTELTNLSQLKARDNAGRIPIDLEFVL